MKYCLRSLVSPTYLSEADEIKIGYRDRASIPEFADKYPEATLILDNRLREPLNWDDVAMWKALSRDKLVICVYDEALAKECKEHNVKFYFGFVANSFYELNAMVEMGAEYVSVGVNLFFNMDILEKKNVKIRVAPTRCFDSMHRENGVTGRWIRPEDIEYYEKAVYVCEFPHYEVSQEEALFRVYAKTKSWPTELGALIPDLNYNGVGRMIPPELAVRRYHCDQSCERGVGCRLCYTMLDLANPELLAQIKRPEKR